MSMLRLPRNSAGRLLGVLNRARRLPDNEAADIAWAIVLRVRESDKEGGLSADEQAEVVVRLGLIHAEIDQLENDIRTKFPVNTSVFLRHVSGLRAVFSIKQIQSGNWQHWIQGVPDVLHHSLEMLSVQLDEEGAIGTDDVTRIKTEIADLIQLIRDTKGLNPAFRKWLLAALADVDAKINQLWILGPRAFKPMYAQLVGEVAISHRAVEEELKTNPEGKPILQRFYSVIDGIGTLASKATVNTLHVLRLAKLSQLLLEGPTDSADAFIDHATGTVLDEMDETLPK